MAMTELLTEEQILAGLRKMMAEHLATVPPTAWWPWIRKMPTAELKRFLMALLSQGVEEHQDRILDLLGTTAGEMTQEELQTWAPAILLTRNRMLATRKDLPPDTTPL